MTGRKKLIEVALPLDAINKASAREKSIRHGHPSTLHLWWARRPLAAARAVIFAQMVDDPSGYVDELMGDSKLRRKAESVLKARRKRWEEAAELARKAREFDMEAPDPGPEPTLEDVIAEQERERLFKIIEDLVQWENTTNETVLQAARDEIWQSWRRTCADNAGHPEVAELFNRQQLPAFHDPFAGGGSLPLEAQRLGLEAYATDLNPVAVLINKAMIEIPPRFAGRPPVNPEGQADKQLFKQDWKGVLGLASDARYYGNWMRQEARKRLERWYPKVKITPQMTSERSDLRVLAEKELTVIAWLWARTVLSPNPAFAQVPVPLASTFLLSTKPGSEAYIEPIVEGSGYRFVVKLGKSENNSAKDGTRLARGANFRCLLSGSPITPDYIMAEGKANRIGFRLMAVVAEGDRGRVYLPPVEGAEELAQQATPEWQPDVEFFQQALGFRVGNYGMTKWSDLYTPRQLLTLTTLSDLIVEVRDQVRRDAETTGIDEDDRTLAQGGAGATAYSEAVATYLAFNISKLSDLNNSLVTWKLDRACPVHLFARQAIPMVWDFPEANPLSESSGSWDSVLWHLLTSMTDACLASSGQGHANQCDAGDLMRTEARVISTDPPYYDNVGYADLSDFFYVWLRRSLRWTFPDLFATLAVPKAEELVATAARHGGRDNAEVFFLDGMTQAMRGLGEESHPAFPVTIYYAFKQAESSAKEGTASTGWETFLDAVISAGFAISGTLPMRTELSNRMRGMGSNALASSIVLVCRRRQAEASATRREFVAHLKSELPRAVALLQAGNIAPVDLAQAAIGPGMAVYTRYSKVLDAEGKPMPVREALALINEVLDESLASQEGDFDADSRWALAWFEQSAFDEGEYGVAETLSKAKNTSVSGLVGAGILTSKGGKVRLLRPEELPPDWDPATDPRLTTWEMVHHLVRTLESGGESAAATLVAKLGSRAETARELCYRLYTICERKKRATEALSYNGLVQSWPEISRLARESRSTVEQGELFGDTP